MPADEAGTLSALKAHRAEVFDPLTAKHNGRIVKLMGDGVLVEFASVVDAVQCAIDTQQALAGQSGAIKLRIGINLGDIIIDGEDIYGDGVLEILELQAAGARAMSTRAFLNARQLVPGCRLGPAGRADRRG